MRRPLLLFSFCLAALVAFWSYQGNVSPGGGPPDGAGIAVTGRVVQKDEKSFTISVDSVQDAALLRQTNSIQDNIKYSESVNEILNKKLLCECDWADKPILDASVLVQGDFYAFSEAANPGEFDYGTYYRSMGYAGRLRDLAAVKQRADGPQIREGLYRLRCFWEKRLYQIFPEKEAGIMSAILLGDKSDLDEETKELYQRNGIIHILSISGLHITFIGMGICRLLKKLRLPSAAAAVAGGVILVLYGMMTGLGISVCRAIGMYLIRMLAQLAGRTYDMLTALGVTGALLVLWHPAWVGHMGFLLSLGSVLGVGAMLPALAGRTDEGRSGPERYVEGVWRRRLAEGRKFLQKGLREGFLAGFAITVTTLPIQLWFSYEIPVYSVFLNLLVLPFMGLLMTTGFGVMLVPGLEALKTVDVLILAGYERLCRGAEKLPFAVWNPGKPGSVQVAVYYLLWAAAVWGVARAGRRVPALQGRRGSVSARLLLIGAAVFAVGISPARGDCVTFLDVGQGDCICVRLSSGEVYLFDCGSSSRSHVGEKALLPFLKYHGIRRVDAVFLSHADEDHINGALEFLQRHDREGIEIGQVILPGIDERLWQEEFGEIFRTAQGLEIAVSVMRAGESWSAGEDVFVCLGPSARRDSEGGNSGSECFYIELKEGENRISLLLTGDVEGQGEKDLLGELRDRKIRGVDVLKVAHHGSKNSTSEELLKQIDPGLSVISCGAGNRYGHPHEELLKRLENGRGKIMNTARDGAVEIQISRRNVRIRAWGR